MGEKFNQLVNTFFQDKQIDVEVTDTIDFIPLIDIPQVQDITYANFVCYYRPLKSEPYQIHLVIVVDKLEYEEDSGATADSLL